MGRSWFLKVNQARKAWVDLLSEPNTMGKAQRLATNVNRACLRNRGNTVDDSVEKGSGTFNGFKGRGVQDAVEFAKKITVSDPVQLSEDSTPLNASRGVKMSDQKKITVSEMNQRGKAIGDLVLHHSPDVICFQEVTLDMYKLFKKTQWGKMYQCSIPNQLAISRNYFSMQGDKDLVVATSHLESPVPDPDWIPMYSKKRVDQANEAFNFLNNKQNVIFCGDMNWDEKWDGQVPLPDNWIDAWAELRPGEDGFTVSKIEIIGTKVIPGLSYFKEPTEKGKIVEYELPVFPSDHYSFLLIICWPLISV